MTLAKEMFSSIKEKKTIYLFLLLIILFGLYFRAYHTNYPVIGYHNWKETHYLTEARNFARDGFFEHGFFVPENDYPPIDADPSGAHSDTFPTTSIIVAVFFKLFGTSLGVARSVGILFSLGTIAMMYLFVKRLFKREDLALIAALLTAINPMFIFFSHNVQLVNPGIFFMLTGAYFYLRWRENETTQDIVLSALFLALAGLTKYTFLVILIPIALTFPVERIKTLKKSRIKAYLFSLIILASIPLWFLYSKVIAAKTGMTVLPAGLIEIGALFTGSWWNIMKSYAADNYTLLGLFFAFIGLLSIGFFLKKKEKFGEKFVLSYALGALLFIFVMSSKLSGHSYHQFPIAPLFIILIAYSFMIISTNVANFLSASVKDEKSKQTNLKAIKYFALAVLFIALLMPSMAAKNRQFDTQFVGLDVAGDYIREHSEPEERIFYSGGQSFGVLWHADRKGYYPLSNLDKIKKGEELGVTWIFAYAWGLNDINNAETMEYISQNYELKQVGIAGENQLMYLLFKKGGTFDLDKLNELIQDKSVHSRDYELWSGKYSFYYINVEE